MSWVISMFFFMLKKRSRRRRRLAPRTIAQDEVVVLEHTAQALNVVIDAHHLQGEAHVARLRQTDDEHANGGGASQKGRVRSRVGP